jgi:triosephosphate isomerase (TIM)
MARRPYIAGNWKMNLSAPEALRLASEVVRTTARFHSVDFAVFPSSAYLMGVAAKLDDTRVLLGAQDLQPGEFGAFTGANSGVQLASVGVGVALIGHSERRHVFGDTDADASAKLRAALDAGLDVMLCIGELEGERDAGTTQVVVEEQVRAGLSTVRADEWGRVSLAYEPVWAIGTGRTATPAQAQEVHAWIRSGLAERRGSAVADAMRILYGGSVKPANAAELLARADIDGCLVGGASLKVESFQGIAAAAAKTGRE